MAQDDDKNLLENVNEKIHAVLVINAAGELMQFIDACIDACSARD
jgi:hypothetical protein